MIKVVYYACTFEFLSSLLFNVKIHYFTQTVMGKLTETAEQGLLEVLNFIVHFYD